MAYTTIKKPSDYFNTVTYTGNAGGQTISGVGHQPDFIWVKQRGDAGYDHSLHNSVSGLLKQLISNSTAAEITNTDTVTSNNADGFVLGADTAGPNANSNNQDGKNYVAWNWKANGTGSANTAGSINSTVSANTTSGFSIVSWTGTSGNTTIGHGLGVIPSVVIAKNIGGSGTNWIVYHKDLSSGYYVKLNLTNPQDNANAYFTADPTNSILSLTGNTAANSNGNNMIAYCFNDVQGYSKFGSYTGNGNADGTFVYTGFKPAFVLQKNYTNGSNNDWTLADNKRPGYNETNKRLVPNTSAAEATNNAIDLLSNGFKCRQDQSNANASGGTYIYMAFAEEPLVGDNPATAR